MKQIPILFSGAMVRACLREVEPKTQTRRVIKGLSKRFPFVNLGQYGAPFSGEMNDPKSWGWAFAEDGAHMPLANWLDVCPYGKPGDRLWVRENGWQRPKRTPKMMREGADTWAKYEYDADGLTEADHEQFKEWGWKRRPSIHMPRWACRLELEVTGVRVERVQYINETDAIAEGCTVGEVVAHRGTMGPFNAELTKSADTAREAYRVLWDSLNAERGYGWAVNPWVWVVEFKRV